MKLLGLGDCCVDYYIHKKMAFPGGNGLNIAVFAAENGAQASFIGTVGTDVPGGHILKSAKEKGVDVSHCPIKTGNSGKSAVNIVDSDRVFVSGFFDDTHGVGTHFPPMLSESDVEFALGHDLVHGSCYAYIEDQLLRFKDSPLLLTYDFSSEDRYRSDAYLQRLCPALELGLFSCEHLPEAEIQALAAKVQGLGCPNVLATMGPRGQMLFTPDSCFTGQAKQIQPVDTMGAGDSFCAAFLVGLLARGWKKGTVLTEAMVVPALEAASNYSARNCLVEGSFAMGLPIEMGKAVKANTPS